MFITKFLTILLLSLNIVKSSDISNEAYEQIQNANKDVRRNNKYNRPPEKAIPVAIVYDDGGREEKSISSKGNDPQKDISLKKDAGKNESLTLIKLSSDFSFKSAKVDSVKVQLPETKIITTEDIQIPVAVIYEAESTTARNRKKVLHRSKVRNQGPLNQRRLQKVEQNVSDDKPATEQFAKQDATSTTKKAKVIITSTEKVNENNAGKKTEAVGANISQKKREREPIVPIIQSENKVFGNNGDFHYSYEGGDGTKAFERGELKSFEDDKTGEAVVGGFSYTDKDGQDFSLSYTADENGYRPVGAHLPTPPPIPPAIERALRYLATKTTPEPVSDSIHSKDETE